MSNIFLHKTLTEIVSLNSNLSKLCIILPSKRAIIYAKKELLRIKKTTFFLPEFFTIEDFLELVSELQKPNQLELIFKLYNSYKFVLKDKAESFDDFLNWGKILLKDFDEIDNYLINLKQFFTYAKEIKKLNYWNLEKTKAEHKHLLFWNSLEEIYYHFVNSLLNNNLGSSGLISKTASEKSILYGEQTNLHHVFIGFNAFNNCELEVVKNLHQSKKVSVFIDFDAYFLSKKNHAAYHHIRKSIDYFKNINLSLNSVDRNFETDKNFNLYKTSGNIEQVKYIGNLVSKLPENELNDSAIILADEKLLLPLLNSLTINSDKINVSMGLPIVNQQLYMFVLSFINLHLKNNDSYYISDIQNLIEFDYLDDELKNDVKKVFLSNKIYFNYKDLSSIKSDLLNTLFKPYKSIDGFYIKLQTLLNHLDKNNLKNDDAYILSEIKNVVNDIINQNTKNCFVEQVVTFKKLFEELCTSLKISLVGNKDKGLQIMGLLETRSLDFKNLFVLSVNEGVLPLGKSNNSNLTFDMKVNFELPTYYDKDAIYAYHFYRLLQRAENVNLFYVASNSGVTLKEPSRFIHQLKYYNTHNINEFEISSKTVKSNKLSIGKKDDDVILALIKIAEKGFSPSSLSSYIRDPYQFYKERILKIKQNIDTSVGLPANDFGTILHGVLESLYNPFINEILSEELLSSISNDKIHLLLKQEFKKLNINSDGLTGKNYLQYNVLFTYIKRFLELEINDIKKGNEIIIKQLEHNLKLELKIDEFDFNINLVGNIDRVDLYNGELRIIDYKSGKVENSNLHIKDWNSLIEDEKLNKGFQLMCYAYMYYKEHKKTPKIAGNLSFRYLNNWVLPVYYSDSTSRLKLEEKVLSEEDFIEFENQLYQLIKNIFNKDIVFEEKELDK